MSKLKEAYDPKKLVEAFKAKGIPLLESQAQDASNIVLDFLEQAAKESDEGIVGQLDDYLTVVFPKARALLAKVFDFNKDGKVGA